VHQKIDLVAGRTTEVNEPLKPAAKMGTIQVSVHGAWAEMYFKGAKVGSGPTVTIRLPVGRQTLHLKNPAAGKEWNVSCDVVENETRKCVTQLP